jgi:2'-5' RNA ligase
LRLAAAQWETLQQQKEMGWVAVGLCMREIPKAILLNYRSGASALTPKINIEGRASVIAYWLIPAEPAHRFFQRLIEDLARRHDAPHFEPHLTIHVGGNYLVAAEKALSKAARECQPINLKVIEINHSDEFVKTLFVQFAPNRKLRQLHQTIRNAAQDSSRYELKPHLSLLYKDMPAVARCELAHSINVSFSEVTFDALKAVRCISPTRSRADVEAWRVVAATSFGT